MEPDAPHGPGVMLLATGLPAARAEELPKNGQLRALIGPRGGLVRFLTADDTEARWCAFGGFAVVLVAIFLSLALQEPVVQTEFGHDSLGFLNTAWKVHCGLLPHRDFSTPLGALNPWLYAAGMELLGPTAAVLPVCNALCGALIGLLAWFAAKGRLPAFAAAFFACTQTVVASAPHAMRWEWYASSYTCYYNRMGSALAAVLLLLFLLPRRATMTRRAAYWDGGIAGIILGVLLFLKISYFMVGGGLCVLSILGGHRFSRAWWWSLAGGFGVVTLACLPLIGFDVAAMWSDLQLAARARPVNPTASFTLGHFLGWLPDAWVEAALLATMQLLIIPRRATRWLEFTAVLGANMFISLTNNPDEARSETPVLTSWMFVLLGCVLSQNPPAPATLLARRNLPAVCSLAGVLWIFTFGTSFRCLCWSALRWPTPWRQAVLADSPPFDADSLADLRMPGNGGGAAIPGTFAGKVNDGIRLLRKLGGVYRVEAFDFVNPFPFAMQWPPARQGLWVWHNGFSFSETAHPTMEQAFGDADILMVPKFPNDPQSFNAMFKVYGEDVRARFQLIDESEQWYVLKRG